MFLCIGQDTSAGIWDRNVLLCQSVALLPPQMWSVLASVPPGHLLRFTLLCVSQDYKGP